MRVLVTGGAGFIGSRLVSLLLSSGHECMAVDNLANGRTPPRPQPQFEFVEQDIRERPSILSSFTAFRPSVVVHLAAIHHIPTCEQDAATALEVNIVGFQSVLDAATGSGCTRVVLASSGAVYEWRDGPLHENGTPTRASDIYSLSKLTNEAQLKLWAAKTNSSGKVARIFNTIGESDPNGHLIPDILRQLGSQADPAVIKLGNLSTSRDYIYVEDTAACLFALVDHPALPGVEFFNIGTGIEYNVRALVERIARIEGKSIEIVVDSERVRKVDRSGQLADMTSTITRLGWRPRYSLDEALKLILRHDRNDVHAHSLARLPL